MAGRGRGRGRGLSINIEALGLGRGDILPAVAHPPPLYPPLLFKPVPIVPSEDLDYMLALKQELRESFHKSPFYIEAPKKIRDIQRYSDKYQLGANEHMPSLNPDWSRLPCELKEKKKRRKISTFIKPNLKRARTEEDDVSALLEKLEESDVKTEAQEETGDKDEVEEEEKKKEKDDDDEEEEEYDEEDLEEETDYNLAYFDNGEGYGDDDEDDDEGPTY